MYDPNPISRSKFADHGLRVSIHFVGRRIKMKHIKPMNSDKNWIENNSQCNRFIPNWIQWCFNRFCFLLNVICVWNEFQFYVRIAQSIWIHWNKISPFFNWNQNGVREKERQATIRLKAICAIFVHSSLFQSNHSLEFQTSKWKRPMALTNNGEFESYATYW